MSANVVQIVLSSAIPLMILATLVWLVLLGYLAYRRKVLNLAKAETVNTDVEKPAFLSVDHDGRQAKLDGGAKFDNYVSERDAPVAPPITKADDAPSKYCAFAKLATIIFALITLVTGVVGAFMRVQLYDETVRSLGVWSNLQSMVKSYPVGFAFALCIVLVTAVNAVRMMDAKR